MGPRGFRCRLKPGTHGDIEEDYQQFSLPPHPWASKRFWRLLCTKHSARCWGCRDEEDTAPPDIQEENGEGRAGKLIEPC